MNEIEKLYVRTGCAEYNYYEDKRYSEFISNFTAEKQLVLILILANREIRINPKMICSGYYLNDFSKCICSMNLKADFAELLAQHTNAIWQDLTEKEQEEIENILKG